MKDIAKKYFDLINGPMRGLNLTSFTDFEEFYTKQFEDSLLPLMHDKLKVVLQDHFLICDLGTGGGFPLIPLANHFSDKKFVGVDSRKKKIEALKQIIPSLNLHNIKLYSDRIENILFDLPCLITFKAVGSIKDGLKLLQTSEKVGVLFYKGPNWKKKEEELPKDLKDLWELIFEINLPLSGTEGRSFLYFENSNVPRRTKPNQKLVKLSQLL